MTRNNRWLAAIILSFVIAYVSYTRYYPPVPKTSPPSARFDTHFSLSAGEMLFVSARGNLEIQPNSQIPSKGATDTPADCVFHPSVEVKDALFLKCTKPGFTIIVGSNWADSVTAYYIHADKSAELLSTGKLFYPSVTLP